MDIPWLAALFAVAAALTIAVGTVMRQVTAEALPAESVGRFGPIVQVLRNKQWWAGTGLSMVGYGLQILALGVGSLLLVQPLLVLSLIFALPISARWTGREISRSEWIWAGVLTAAVAVTLIEGRPQPGDPRAAWWLSLVAVGVGLVVVWGIVRLAETTFRRDRALFLGMATGIVFGYVALLSKGVVDRFTTSGFLGVISTPELYLLVFSAILGTAIQQSSFHAGAIQQSLPAMTVTEPLVAAILGLAILGESFMARGVEVVMLVGAVALIVVAVIQLARSEAQRDFS